MQDCSFKLNTEQALSWISTDGFSITVDTDSAAFTQGYAYDIWYYYYLSTTSVLDKFYVTIDAAPDFVCILTSLTTDGALSNTVVQYLEQSGPQTYPMDTIISQTPDCKHESFTYSVREDTLGDMTGYGITVDNKSTPPTLNINSTAAAPTTYYMKWFA